MLPRDDDDEVRDTAHALLLAGYERRIVYSYLKTGYLIHTGNSQQVPEEGHRACQEAAAEWASMSPQEREAAIGQFFSKKRQGGGHSRALTGQGRRS